MYNWKLHLSKLRPERLRQIDSIIALLVPGCWLAGGALRSIILSEIPTDFDLFCKHAQVAKDQECRLVDNGWKVIFRCPAGEMVTLTKRKEKIQIITPKFYNDPWEVLDSFDFTSACCATDGVFLFWNKAWVIDNLKKRLRVNVITYPIASMRRILKYVKKGFTVDGVFWAGFAEELSGKVLDETTLRLYID